MKRYRIELRGENFLLNHDGEPRRFDFVLARYLLANDEATAEKTAIIQARQLPALKHGLCNDPEDPPRIELTEIREVNPLTFSLRRKKILFEMLAAQNDPFDQA